MTPPTALLLVLLATAAGAAQSPPTRGYQPLHNDLPGITPELLQYTVPNGTLTAEFGALLVLLRETGSTFPIPIAPIRMDNGDWFTMDQAYITERALWANLLSRPNMAQLSHFAFLEYAYGLYIGSTPQGRTMLSAIENVGRLVQELSKSEANLTGSNLHWGFASNIFELSTEYAMRWSHIKPTDFFSGLIITGDYP